MIADGNKLLREGFYNLDLFNASPVPGCYFLTLAETSTGINYSVHDMGTQDEKDTVEQLHKRAQPVRRRHIS